MWPGYLFLGKFSKSLSRWVEAKFKLGQRKGNQDYFSNDPLQEE